MIKKNIFSNMANKELVKAQHFFKGVMQEDIAKYKDEFSLSLESFDLDDEVLKQLEELISSTNNLNDLSIRLSDTISDTQILNKVFRRIAKKKFKTLSFYIKQLNKDLFECFINYLSKINTTVETLNIKIKDQSIDIEREYSERIINTLTESTTSKVQNLGLTELRTDTETLINALNNLITSREYTKIILGNKKLFQNKITFDLSKIKSFYFLSSNLYEIHNLPLVRLDLTANNISKKGLKILADLLANENTKLELLTLSENYIGDRGCEILANGIKKNKSLEKLTLKTNHILDAGCVSIAKALTENKTIKRVNFADNYISNAGVIQMCEILSKEPADRFTKLDISRNIISDDGFLAYSKFLNMQNNINTIKIRGKLTEKVRFEFFRNLQRMKKIEAIEMSNLDLNGQAMEYLNEILERNEGIKRIDLSNNKNILFNAEKLANGIKCNLNLTSINLNTCNIGDIGATMLADCLFNNMSIKELFLSNNEIGLQGLKSLSEKVLRKKCLKKLNLEHNKINHLGAYHMGIYLADAFGIEYLNLNCNQIGDEGCEFLAKGIKGNNSLMELHLDQNNITNKGVRLLAGEIKNKINFIKLTLSENKITEVEEDLYILFSWCSDLRLPGNPISNEGIIRIFHGTEDNRLFKTLRLCDLEKENEIFIFKSNNQFLKKFDFAYNKINISLLKNIVCLSNISYLGLQDNFINDDGITKLCKFITNYKSNLKTLILVNNKFGEVGGEKIAEMLQTNTKLKELNISTNKITFRGMAKIFKALADFNKTLTILYANNTGINDYCSNEIYEMLSKNNTLKSLNIMTNNLTSSGVDLILSALRVNKTLKILSIGNSLSNSKGFKNLDKYLALNNTLKCLEIKNNHLTDDALLKINKGAESNKELISFNLVNNDLTFDGISKMAVMMDNYEHFMEAKLLLNQTDSFERDILVSSYPHIVFN